MTGNIWGPAPDKSGGGERTDPLGDNWEKACQGLSLLPLALGAPRDSRHVRSGLVHADLTPSSWLSRRGPQMEQRLGSKTPIATKLPQDDGEEREVPGRETSKSVAYKTRGPKAARMAGKQHVTVPEGHSCVCVGG